MCNVFYLGGGLNHKNTGGRSKHGGEEERCHVPCLQQRELT